MRHLIRILLIVFPPDKEAPEEAEEEEKEAKGDASNDADKNHDSDIYTDDDLPKEHSVGGDKVITVTRTAPGEITTRSRAALGGGVSKHKRLKKKITDNKLKLMKYQLTKKARSF